MHISLTRREKVAGQIEVSDRRIFVAEMLLEISESIIHAITLKYIF